jgi:uncharacterized protein with GYD domain
MPPVDQHDEEESMAKYLVIANYKPEGVKGLLAKGGTARSEAVAKAIAGVGGTVESFHFAFGADDAYVIVDAPDNVAVASVAMQVASTGVVDCRVVVLLEPAEIDDAAKLQVDYAPPGK